MIKCDYCGKTGAKVNFVSRSYGKNIDLLIIEDIPVIACPHCKETVIKTHCRPVGAHGRCS